MKKILLLLAVLPLLLVGSVVGASGHGVSDGGLVGSGDHEKLVGDHEKLVGDHQN